MQADKKVKKRQFNNASRFNQLRSMELREKIKDDVRRVMTENPGISKEGVYSKIGHDLSIIGIYYGMMRRELYPRESK